MSENKYPVNVTGPKIPLEEKTCVAPSFNALWNFDNSNEQPVRTCTPPATNIFWTQPNAVEQEEADEQPISKVHCYFPVPKAE